MLAGLKISHCDVYVARRRAENLRREELRSKISQQYRDTEKVRRFHIQCKLQQQLLKQKQKEKQKEVIKNQQLLSHQQQSKQVNRNKIFNFRKATCEKRIISCAKLEATLDPTEVIVNPPYSQHPEASGKVRSLDSCSITKKIRDTQPGLCVNSLGDSQLNIYRYPKHIKTQRLFSSNSRIQPFTNSGNFNKPERLFPTLQTTEESYRYSNSTKQESTISSLDTTYTPLSYRLCDSFQLTYDFFKRIALTSKLNTASTSTRDGKPIRVNDFQKQTKAIKLDINEKQPHQRCCNKKSAEENKPQGPSVVRGSAFQCCTCGRVIVVKKRNKRETKATFKPQNSSNRTKPEQEERNRISSRCIEEEESIRQGFKMTAYQVFSWSCFLAASTLLYTAYRHGYLDSVIDYRTGPYKDFYILVGLYVVAKILWSALKEVWKLFETCDETFMEAEQWAGNVGNSWMCGLVTGRRI
ncbi:hypothetical protein PoB_005447800 [Plakobranchus ocellatus]|uniref:Gustatory receptor n=1 Tax=Plakobranchus ocellatus TaxID=259542 RepID=A0AAV4CAG5_9GAST|nr:hypothetical protein PoB_005447800 [Plakobranchus ocellatus]